MCSVTHIENYNYVKITLSANAGYPKAIQLLVQKLPSHLRVIAIAKNDRTYYSKFANNIKLCTAEINTGVQNSAEL